MKEKIDHLYIGNQSSWSRW